MKKESFKTILIVEDNHDILFTLKHLCETEGYTVLVAENGSEAIDKLKILGNENRPCLILTDLMMPVMSGYELLEHLSKDDVMAVIPVVVMSANQEFPKGQRILKKPFLITELIDTINEICKDK